MSDTWFVIICRLCSPDYVNNVIPFESAEARGKWAAEHTRGTGHDSWIVLDHPRNDAPEDNSVDGVDA